MNSLQRGLHTQWILLGAAVLAVASLLLTVFSTIKEGQDNQRQTERNQESVACVATWANAFEARSNRLSALTDSRGAALDALVRALNTNNQKTIETADRTYLRASDDYQKALKADPLPPSPMFLCNQGDAASERGPQSSPAGSNKTSTISVTATPAPVTRSATATTTAHAHSTSTVVIGATSTATRVVTHTARVTVRPVPRTVTITRTPPQLLPTLCVPVLHCLDVRS